MAPDEFSDALLDSIGQFRKPADIRKEHGDFPPRPSQRKLLSGQQFIHDLGRDDPGENRLHSPPLGLLENHTPGD